MVDPESRSPEIVEGEFVDPYLLRAVVEARVPTGGDRAAVDLSPAQVLERLRRSRPPSWAGDLPLGARVRVQAALERAGFDLAVRLDDHTLVAAYPDGDDGRLQVLELHRAGVDSTRIDLFRLELAAGDLVVVDPERPQALDGAPLLRATAVRLEDLPDALTRYRPGLVLRERLRLALAFDELQLGAPVSMLTLLPGERRSVRVVRTGRTRVEETAELTRESSAAREITAGLQREFRDGWERQRRRERLAGIVWSRRQDAEAPGGESSVARELADESQDAWSLETDAVRETLDRAALTAGREVAEVRVVEGIRERVDGRERTDVVELENGREDPVTYVAHRVLAAYQAHLDLVDAELRWYPEEPSEGPVRVDLRRDWQRALEEIPGPDRDAIDVVAGLLQARYGELGALADDDARLLPAAADAVNLELMGRDPMLAPDRRERRGPLPVCLLSRRLAVRTGGTFVRTYAGDPGLSAPSSAPGGS